MKKIFSVILMSIFIFSSSVVWADAEKLALYIDKKAENGGDGSLKLPFSDFDSAKEHIRDLKKQGAYPSGGITVYVREGEYSLKDGLKFDEEDSGVKDACVTWRPYFNENVKLIGGAEIELSDCTEVSDSDILSKIPSAAKDKVRQINLRQQNIAPYNELYVTGHASYYTRLYGITKGTLPVPEIFYNGEAMPLAQYPNKGEYMRIGKVINYGDDMIKWNESQDPNKKVAPAPSTFSVEDTRIKRWASADQAWVFGYWQWDWSDQTIPVSKIDTEAQTITPYYQSYYTVTPGQRFYIYNLIEELDVPGEWFLDKNTGILYLYPLDNNADSSMLLSFSDKPVVTFNNASNINFREFEISGTRNCGIQANDCSNLKLSYLSVSRLSGEGIVASGTDITIEGCHIYDTGMKGIDIRGGGPKTLTSCNNLIFNNHIHNFGRLVKTYEGALTGGTVGMVVKNNLMYDGAHLAITPGGNDNIFEYNEIHSVLKEASDMGAIYTNFGMTSRGNVFRYNKIHDCATDSTQGHKVQAIYFDNSSSGSEVYGNLIYNIGGDGVFINGGRNNTVRHNIFANLNNSVTLNASGMAVSWGWYDAWLNGTRTFGLKGEDIVPYTSELYSKYPNMNNILEDDPPLPKYNILEKNISYNTNGEYNIDPLSGTGSGLKVEDMYKMSTINTGLETKSDIGFTNIAENKFSLEEDSKAYGKIEDFPKIDYSRMGLVSSQLKSLLLKDSIALVIDKPITYVNWERKLIDKDNAEAVPFLENSKTYVPVRFLFENFGASVEWNDDGVTADYNGDSIELKPQSDTAIVNGVDVKMEAPAIIKDGRTYVPLRDISNLLSKSVLWDDRGLIVISGEDITKKMNEDMIYDLYNRM